MRVQADLRCYHCGYVAAHVEGDRDQPLSQMRLVPSTGGLGVRLRPQEPPRCGRCGGPLYQDALESIRPDPVVFDPFEERRPLDLTGDERRKLERRARARTSSQQAALRARIVRHAAEGTSNTAACHLLPFEARERE